MEHALEKDFYRKAIADTGDKQELLPSDILEHSSVYNIVNSDAFKRLDDIRFLGAIDYTFKPSKNFKRHTRFEHTLGVTRLVKHAYKFYNLSKLDEKYLLTAALLHDIGHAPLSHTLESVFKEKFSINHHIASEKLIKGEAPIGKDIAKYLRDDGLDVDKVLALISGDTTINGHELFSSNFNVDTLDGIIRTSLYTSKSETYNGTSPQNILITFLENSILGRDKLDSFWNLKKDMYSLFIQGSKGVMADTIAKIIFAKNISRINEDFFYSTEDQLFKLFPEIRQFLFTLFILQNSSKSKLRLKKIINDIGYNPIEIASNNYHFKKHVFSIDENASVDALHNRYKRTKQTTSVKWTQQPISF